MNPEISYWSNAADETMATELVVAPNGDATLTITSNRDRPEAANAGVFRMRLKGSDLAAFVDAVRSNSFTALQNPSSALSGSVVRKITLKEDAKPEIMKFVGEDAPAPPAFVAAETRALEIAKVVRQHPVFALGIKLAGMPARFDRGQSVRFKVDLENIGSETVRIVPPPQWTPESVRFEIVGLRADVALADLRSHHQRFEQVSSADVRSFQPSAAAGAMLELARGQRLTLDVERKLDWPPGEYEVRVFYLTSIFNSDGGAVARCELTLKAVRIRVSGESRPDDNTP